MSARLWLLLSAFLALALGCDGCDRPCATDADCASGQRCEEGRCVAAAALPSDASDLLDSGPPSTGEPDAGTADAGPADAGRAGADAGELDAGSQTADAGELDAGSTTDGGRLAVDAGEIACTSSRDCDATERICAELRDEGSAVTPYCAAPGEGPDPLGVSCESGLACETGLCIPRAQSCGVACEDAALDCASGQACTAYPFGTQAGAFSFIGVCVNACTNDDSCQSGRVCTYNGNPLSNVFDAVCEVPLGPLQLGASCSEDADCESGLCLSEGCSRVCESSNDCAQGAPGNTMTTCRDVLVGAPTGAGPDVSLRLCRQ